MQHITAAHDTVVDSGGMEGGANTGTKVWAEKAMETRAEKLRAPQPAEFRVHILSVSLS